MSKKFFVKNGCNYSSSVTEKCLDFAINYKPKNEDLFLVSHRKSGMNWTYFIIQLIANNGVHDHSIKDSALYSWLEANGADTLFKPTITTHLPYELLPKNPLAKYVVVFRNPKDTVVSHYYHAIRLQYLDESHDFHQFFSQWMAGEWMGDYFRFVADYWRHRIDGNFHYLFYERMKRKPKEVIVKIAEILGKQFVDQLMANNEWVLNEVLNKSSFDYMKSNNCIDGRFMRKGIVGDWRSHLTRDESDSIDAKFTEYFAGSELESIWREDMKWH